MIHQQLLLPHIVFISFLYYLKRRLCAVRFIVQFMYGAHFVLLGLKVQKI